MSQLHSQGGSLSKTTRSESGNVPSKTIPVQITDVSTFDDTFSFLKERFASEMKRMDEEMNKFSMDLINLYGQSSIDSPALNWDSLAGSSLIQGEGEDKILKLQFDLSQFDPDEITVQLRDEMLVITAVHSEKNDTTSVLREFKREFLLPKGIDLNSVQSTLSRDGVLRIQAPLPQMKPVLDKTFLAVREEVSSVTAIEAPVAISSKEAPEKKAEKKRSKEHKREKETAARDEKTRE